MNNLTCQTGNFSSRNPGYIYWKGVCIEHYGPMGDDWEDTWQEKIAEIQHACENLERLGIPVNGKTFLQYDYFGWATKRKDIEYLDYFIKLGDFYLRGENEIAFLEEVRADYRNSWKIDFIAHVWHTDTCIWTTEKYYVECPDVEYHEMIRNGWKHGGDWWKDNENTRNICSHSYKQIVACYHWYALPNEYPF